MNSTGEQKRMPWAFWAACGVAAAGGVLPFLLAGTSGRIDGIIVPFGLAAAAFAGCALLDDRGRGFATVLYLVGGFAIVYGILGLVATLLQMTVLSPCPPAPAECAPGFTRPLTHAESTGLSYAIGLGGLAALFGFAGLLSNYRRHRARAQAEAQAMFTPPARRVAPVAAPPAAPVAAPPAAPSAPQPEPPATDTTEAEPGGE